jgi:hypothetical protein
MIPHPGSIAAAGRIKFVISSFSLGLSLLHLGSHLVFTCFSLGFTSFRLLAAFGNHPFCFLFLEFFLFGRHPIFLSLAFLLEKRAFQNFQEKEKKQRFSKKNDQKTKRKQRKSKILLGGQNF